MHILDDGFVVKEFDKNSFVMLLLVGIQWLTAVFASGGESIWDGVLIVVLTLGFLFFLRKTKFITIYEDAIEIHHEPFWKSRKVPFGEIAEVGQNEGILTYYYLKLKNGKKIAISPDDIKRRERDDFINELNRIQRSVAGVG